MELPPFIWDESYFSAVCAARYSLVLLPKSQALLEFNLGDLVDVEGEVGIVQRGIVEIIPLGKGTGLFAAIAQGVVDTRP
jgi:hypothetical protein